MPDLTHPLDTPTDCMYQCVFEQGLWKELLMDDALKLV